MEKEQTTSASLELQMLALLYNDLMFLNIHNVGKFITTLFTRKKITTTQNRNIHFLDLNFTILNRNWLDTLLIYPGRQLLMQSTESIDVRHLRQFKNFIPKKFVRKNVRCTQQSLGLFIWGLYRFELTTNAACAHAMCTEIMVLQLSLFMNLQGWMQNTTSRKIYFP